MDRGAWRATVHGVAKSRTRLTNCHSSKHAAYAEPTELSPEKQRVMQSAC